MKLKITVFAILFSLLFISCKTTEGKTINGDGTVTVDLTLLFKDYTSADANRVRHLTQNLDLEHYTEIEKYTEDKYIPKGTALQSLARNDEEFKGFTAAGLIVQADQD
ncbi:MAG: hypothetical protein J6W60_02200, partial [Treponema sp.]|nr:hypothetical protein [Treponema sp.]